MHCEGERVVADIEFNKQGDLLLEKHKRDGVPLFPAIGGAVQRSVTTQDEFGNQTRRIEKCVICTISLASNNADPRIPALEFSL